jgi:hypothetical protein
MKEIIFVSRHKATAPQLRTVELEGFSSIRNLSNVIFDVEKAARPQLEAAGVDTSKPFGMVAPGWFFRKALDVEGCPCIYEFINEPSARQRGVFLCKGMIKHTAGSVEFIPCPVPYEDQEEEALAPPSQPR